MSDLTESDRTLINEAAEAMKAVPKDANISVVSVVRDYGGKTYRGYNFGRGHYLGSVCGELAAFNVGISQAAPARFEPDTIASVKLKNGKLVVANSCGSCLQRFKDEYPELKIVSVNDQDQLYVATAAKLLPHGYDQHRAVVDIAA